MVEVLISWFVGALGTITIWVNEISNGNPFMAGVILTGLIGLAIRIKFIALTKIPRLIFRRITISVYIDSFGADKANYKSLLRSLGEHSTDGGSRSFKISRRLIDSGNMQGWTRGYRRIPGLGVHKFIFNRRLYWYSIKDMPSDGIEEVKSRMTLTTFGLGHKPIDSFLRTLDTNLGEDEIVVRGLTRRPSGAAEITKKMIKVPMLTELAMNDDVRNNLKDIVDEFFNSEYRYVGSPIPSKFTLLLHGEPGSGKTSTLISLAREMGFRSVSSIPISRCESVGDLERLCNKDDDEYLFLILEDIHSNINLTRDKSEKGHVPQSIDLSDMLNFLNGVVPLNKVFCVMTTNYIDDLEPALLRPCRVDMVAELPRLTPEVSNSYISRYIPDWNAKDGFDMDVRGCDISQIFGCSNMEPGKIRSNIVRAQESIPEKPNYEYDDSNKVDLSAPQETYIYETQV